MVSFTSISNGIKLCLLVSSFVYTVSGAPAASSDAATHTTTDNSSDFTLPSVISGRAKVPSFGTPDLSIEQDSIDKNNDWVAAQNSTSSSKRKRDSLVAGLFMDLPSIYPPIIATHDANTKTPSASDISTYTKYAELASTPYCRTVVPLGAWDCANCLSSVPDGVLVNTFSSLIDDTNGFILRSDKDKVIYLAFRGTNLIRSAIVDLEFNFANYPSVSGAKVHSGFLDSYNSVISDYFPVLQAQLTAHPSYKVIITGHSLGGAQAVLAGMDLYLRESRLGPDNMSIYTYGCPRVGNPTFAYFADGTGISHTRVVHKRDIVPHLPPMSFGFLHQGVESWIITDPNTVQTCTPDIEIDECADSIVPFTSFTDHLTVKQGDQGAFQKFERGEIKFEEFCKLFGDQLSHPLNKDNYKEYLKRTGKAVPKVILDVIVDGKELFKVMIGESNRVDNSVLRVIENLRASKKYTIAVLTNSYELPKNNPKEMEEMGMGVIAGLRHLFDHFIESQVAGLRKPDPNFFIYACDLIGIKPEEAIFLDDIGVNIQAAKNLGITTIHVKMGQSYNAIKELESLTGLDLHSTIESKL